MCIGICISILLLFVSICSIYCRFNCSRKISYMLCILQNKKMFRVK